MEIPSLQDVVIIFGLSVMILLLCHRLHIPTLVGFFITGILCGPHGLGFINNIEHVDNLAQVGIIFLLFTIGLEFSLTKLLEIKRFFFVGGALQVLLTTLAGCAVAQYLHRPLGESLFLGFLLSMSSTAIVLKALEQHDEQDSLQGRVSLGILIFQDLIAVPMMIVIPILSSETKELDSNFIFLLLKGCLIISLIFIAAIKLMPKVLYYIAKVRSRELFLLSVLFICFSVTWISFSLGLSITIGAFLAGLIVSESEYSREAISNVIPIRDIFASFFFVSMGMLLDIKFILHQPFLIVGIALSIMLMKFSIIGITSFALGVPLRVLIISALALCQIGEFSFVLARTGIEHHLGSEFLSQLFLSVALLTMAASPSLIHFSAHFAKYLGGFKMPNILRHGFHKHADRKRKWDLKNHILIIGYGISGRNLARACKEAEIPYLIVEMNPETVKRESKKGEPIIYGDATHEDVLMHMNINEAKSVAVVINDARAAKRIVELAKRINPSVYLIVRTRYILDKQLLYKLGANDVISDEFGSSIEILVRMLKQHQVTDNAIDKCASTIRNEGYEPITG